LGKTNPLKPKYKKNNSTLKKRKKRDCCTIELAPAWIKQIIKQAIEKE